MTHTGSSVSAQAGGLATPADTASDTSDAPTPGAQGAEDNAAADAEPSFVDDVLTTPDVVIKITDHKVIPVGDEGNEYGDVPVMAFWYTITNVTGKDVSPMEWIYYFNAYQDNDPNALQKLDVAALPDDRYLDSQMAKIKKGGTLENAVAYELNDAATPVDLVASTMLGRGEIGKATYSVK